MIRIALAAIYLSLLVDLLVFPVPSEASTRQLLSRSTHRCRDVVRFLLPSAVGVALFLLPVAIAAWPPLLDLLGPLPGGWPVLGLGIAALGRAVAAVAAIQLHGADGLVETGVFAVSRNPIVGGMCALYAGACLVTPCVVLVVGLVLFAVNLDRRVRREEAHLAAVHGARYAAYRQRVGRYLGW